MEITDTMAILEWMIPQAADTINRFLVGDDGRTAYYRVRHKNFHGKVYEFGEQVLAKPKRINKQIKKKGALEPTFHDATWAGYNDRSNEHFFLTHMRTMDREIQKQENTFETVHLDAGGLLQPLWWWSLFPPLLLIVGCPWNGALLRALALILMVGVGPSFCGLEVAFLRGLAFSSWSWDGPSFFLYFYKM